MKWGTRLLAKIRSFALSGINGFEVAVEVNLAHGLPTFEVVGLPDAAVKESRERVRTALKNSGFGFPDDHLIVNLAPADQKKEGPVFDLPIAVGVLAASGRLPQSILSDVVIIGELSLDGTLRPMRGALPVTISALEANVKAIILPAPSAHEACCVEGIKVLPANSLTEVFRHLSGDALIPPLPKKGYMELLSERKIQMDFAHVKGQSSAKRALEIAAAGGHNVLMIGPPGSGKTLLASCIPGILPDMSFEEALSATRIHSVSGSAPETGLLTERPFRSPHHTASPASIVGGGMSAMPGEISKAHQGVLFMDELPEYRRDVLEVLRQPMEDGVVTVTRVGAQMTYPSQFMLVCSMNPCPCGHYGSRTHTCRCTPMQIRRYLNRISGPLLDRIDMHVEVESVPTDRIASKSDEEPSCAIRTRVEQARAVQRKRYEGEDSLLTCNARLNAKTLSKYCKLSQEAESTLKQACESMNLSNRAYTRILKLARTIADLAHSDNIQVDHVLEAVQYRTLDRKYWG